MDALEIVGYASLGVLVLLLVATFFAGLSLSLPGMIVGVLALVGLGSLVLKVFRDRMGNAEDDHYSNTVDQ